MSPGYDLFSQLNPPQVVALRETALHIALETVSYGEGEVTKEELLRHAEAYLAFLSRRVDFDTTQEEEK